MHRLLDDGIATTLQNKTNQYVLFIMETIPDLITKSSLISNRSLTERVSYAESVSIAWTHHVALHWCHNDREGVSNHQPHGCLLNLLSRRRSKKTSKLRVTGLCVGNSPGPVNSPHKGPVTRKMFPFDDVIMESWEQQLGKDFAVTKQVSFWAFC